MPRLACSLAAAFFAWFALVAPGSSAEPIKSSAAPRKITATATATAYLKLDSARLSFVITTAVESGRSARDANEVRAKKVREALAALPLGKTEVDVRLVPTGTVAVVGGEPGQASDWPVQAKLARCAFHVTVSEKNPDRLRYAVGRLSEAAAELGGAAQDSDSVHFRIGNNAEPEAVPRSRTEWSPRAGPKNVRRQSSGRLQMRRPMPRPPRATPS